MYYLKNKKHNSKSKDTVDNDNKVFRQNHYNNMHKTVEQYKKQHVELERQVEDLQLLAGERDAEALQDHLTEQHMRQLLGTEPLQAILGAISKKEEHDKHYYVQMIDSMDPMTALQQEQQEKEEGDTNEEVSLQQKAKEIVAAIQQRKQQSRQQQRQPTTINDSNGSDGREEDTTRRRVETPDRNCRETRKRSTTNKEEEKTTICCCYYDYSPSFPLYSDHVSFTYCVYYIAICCSATTASFQLR